MHRHRHVLVTGASSGLGAAMAARLAAPGVTLTLVARRPEKLAETAEICRTAGAAVRIAPADVGDAAAMGAVIAAAEAALPVDGAIACAGIGASGGRKETPETAQLVFQTNLAGAVNTAGPLLPRMAARGFGRVALVASLAGYLALPDAPAYSASKAALIAWGDAQRRLWRGTGVHVSVVCPGFVETEMTADLPRPLPFLWPVDRAAERIVDGFLAGRARIAFPWQMHALATFGRALPRPVQDLLLRPGIGRGRNRRA